jgi:hypothetical protein
MTIASILATKGNKVVTIRPEQSIRDALRSIPTSDRSGSSPSATSSARRCETSRSSA